MILLVFFSIRPVATTQQDETKKDRDEIALVDRTLRALARKLGYRVVLSLANSKKAGSAALIK